MPLAPLAQDKLKVTCPLLRLLLSVSIVPVFVCLASTVPKLTVFPVWLSFTVTFIASELEVSVLVNFAVMIAVPVGPQADVADWEVYHWTVSARLRTSCEFFSWERTTAVPPPTISNATRPISMGANLFFPLPFPIGWIGGRGCGGCIG